jgi:hypothetical protein
LLGIRVSRDQYDQAKQESAVRGKSRCLSHVSYTVRLAEMLCSFLNFRNVHLKLAMECVIKTIVLAMLLTAVMIDSNSKSPGESELLRRIDHLVYATPDLNHAIDEVERLTGVRATPGGQHLGLGTRNALISLGPRTYLEIIGPDPEQPAPREPRPFGIDENKQSRIVTWAANSENLEQLRRDAERSGILLGVVGSGSRKRPDGVLLAWRYTNPRTIIEDGIVPFFIDWGSSPHPSETAAKGLRLVELRAEHPDANRAEQTLKQLGLDLRVKNAAKPGLVAVIDGPKGRVELR